MILFEFLLHHHIYHVMSRTALEGFPLGDVEKDYFIQVVKQLRRIIFKSQEVDCF